ncbi:MAG TPA: PHB depolymerase family esterase [Pseudonocardiaceae bacterium]|jgi:poly(3-hydroxybutyrate) depolymerase
MITLAQLTASGHPYVDLLTGRTPSFACQADQRFSYCLYVPRDIDTSRAHPLVVTIHGTERAPESYRDGFADLADKHQCVVLAPLFPAGIGDPDDVDNYKTLDYRGIRFDLLLLEMVAEVGARWPVATDRVYLHGFSGGGQFAHRFLYLHPDRLAGVSVGAPGSVTLLDQTKPWPAGTADLAQRFGTDLDLPALRSIPVLLFIGEQDDQPHPLTGASRVAGIAALRDNLIDNGLDPAFETEPGVGHEQAAIFPAANRFFDDLVQREHRA